MDLLWLVIKDKPVMQPVKILFLFIIHQLICAGKVVILPLEELMILKRGILDNFRKDAENMCKRYTSEVMYTYKD